MARLQQGLTQSIRKTMDGLLMLGPVEDSDHSYDDADPKFVPMGWAAGTTPSTT